MGLIIVAMGARFALTDYIRSYLIGHNDRKCHA
jgi:hypothetical protein